MGINKEKDLVPTQFCENQGKKFIEVSTQGYRKEKGQFFTPLSVARFMASLAPIRKKALKILDPGAGAGILACAVIEEAASTKIAENVHIDAYENDPKLAGYLRESLEFTEHWLNGRGVELTYNVFEEDFILGNCRNLLNRTDISCSYDIAISNPPYFKIGKNDPRAKAARQYVHGQPNIYSLFMGVTSELLRKKGVMVFITPRSYAAGPYFKVFRQHFFQNMHPERVHLFESRNQTFRAEDVLQENVILKACKMNGGKTVGISVTEGSKDINRHKVYRVPVSTVLWKKDNDIVFRLPVNDYENSILSVVDQWGKSLLKFGWNISTGPVVPFRAKELIPTQEKKGKGFVPLLWMQNVLPMKTIWPLQSSGNGKEKRQFIKDNEESRRRKLLVKSANIVLLRRFSAKEQSRRLTASPLLKRQLSVERIGIENHLNYIYRVNGSLTEIEALGISALLNSSLLDQYFRISNGNTQVSATELRAMPLPPLKVIEQLGRKVREMSENVTLQHVDSTLGELLGLDLK